MKKTLNPSSEKNPVVKSPARRRFLGDACALSISGLTTGAAGVGVFLSPQQVLADGFDFTNFTLLKALSGEQRQEQVYRLRQHVARLDDRAA